MKIAAILGVKDEAEILEASIAHLRSIGVEKIIAHDAGSSDGSERILARHAGPDFLVVEHSDVDPDAAAWNRLHERLARESGADWVLFQDADEFWMPATGDLRDCLASSSADILTVPRYNVALGPDGPYISGAQTPSRSAELQLICKAPERFRAQLEENSGIPWIRGVPVPKVIARRGVVGKIGDAGHEVTPPDGVEAVRAVPADLFIAHLPFTTLSRFALKLANVRKVFEVHSDYFGDNLAWHWRRWLAMDNDSAVAAEFEHQVLDAGTLAEFRRAGIVQSSSEIFASTFALGAHADR
jgi:glycosyltransferase involved in cell wall biosynthesis